jgi:type III secretion protein J
MKTFAAIVLLLLSGCSAKIEHGLAEREANEVRAALEERGITVELVGEGKGATWSVEVPKASAAQAIRLLRDADLPRRDAPGFAEVFGQGSLVPTAAEERARMIQALSGETCRMLAAIEGVVRARVLVVPEFKSQGFGTPEPARASVFLKVTSERAGVLATRKVELQQLVAGAVPGLTPEHVAVLFDTVSAAPRPVVIERKDRSAALAVACASGLLIALLAGALVLATLRSRKLRVALGESTPEDGDDADSAPAPRKAA